jgi:alpha-L-fucosidase
MKLTINQGISIFLLSCLLSGRAQVTYAQSTPVLPTQSQVEWADSEIGVLIHYDMWVYKSDNGLPSLSVFNPTGLNTDQWVKAAKDAGARYAVLTVKHAPGFCLWPTKVPGYEYHIGNTPYKGGKADIALEFVKSCRKFGIKPGFYYSLGSNHYLRGDKKPSDEELKRYNEVEYQQLTELWTSYGKLFEIWFDGGVIVDKKVEVVEKVSELLKKYQPDAIVFQGPVGADNIIRWSGNEDGTAAYPNWSRADEGTSSDGMKSIPDMSGNPDGKYWIPAEADMPNRKNYGWGWFPVENYDKIHPPFSPDELLAHYYTSAGHNANMLIGMAIDSTGSFPESDVRIFKEFGDKLKQRESSKIGSNSGKGKTITIKLSKAQDFNQIEIQEDISKGERIRKYSVEALVNGNWQKVCDGISVGHKRIQLFDRVKASSIRLNILQSDEEPIIKNFAAYML